MDKLIQIWFYLVVVIFVLFALAVLYLLRYQPLAQFGVIIAVSSLYFVAGVAYHLIKKDLTRQAILEFGGIAIFVILSFGILTFWRII